MDGETVKFSCERTKNQQTFILHLNQMVCEQQDVTVWLLFMVQVFSLHSLLWLQYHLLTLRSSVPDIINRLPFVNKKESEQIPYVNQCNLNQSVTQTARLITVVFLWVDKTNIRPQ